MNPLIGQPEISGPEKFGVAVRAKMPRSGRLVMRGVGEIQVTACSGGDLKLPVRAVEKISTVICPINRCFFVQPDLQQGGFSNLRASAKEW
jgi:hypothetical protein